jgi:hypothetical protein
MAEFLRGAIKMSILGKDNHPNTLANILRTKIERYIAAGWTAGTDEAEMKLLLRLWKIQQSMREIDIKQWEWGDLADGSAQNSERQLVSRISKAISSSGMQDTKKSSSQYSFARINRCLRMLVLHCVCSSGSSFFYSANAKRARKQDGIVLGDSR